MRYLVLATEPVITKKLTGILGHFSHLIWEHFGNKDHLFNYINCFENYPFWKVVHRYSLSSLNYIKMHCVLKVI